VTAQAFSVLKNAIFVFTMHTFFGFQLTTNLFDDFSGKASQNGFVVCNTKKGLVRIRNGRVTCFTREDMEFQYFVRERGSETSSVFSLFLYIFAFVSLLRC